MTKSQNTKNEQQKDLCITSEQLTEQYLNGKLHDGDEYYIQDKDGEISTICLYNTTMHWHSFKVKKLKVLAPVPRYEEWFQIKNLASLTSLLQEKNIECLHRENKLKELLKECIPYFNELVEKRLKLEYIPQVYELITKINEVLR